MIVARLRVPERQPLVKGLIEGRTNRLSFHMQIGVSTPPPNLSAGRRHFHSLWSLKQMALAGLQLTKVDLNRTISFARKSQAQHPPASILETIKQEVLCPEWVNFFRFSLACLPLLPHWPGRSLHRPQHQLASVFFTYGSFSSSFATWSSFLSHVTWSWSVSPTNGN